MFFLKILNVLECRLRVWTDTFVGVKKDFFETTIHAHALVRSQIVQKSCQPLFESNRHVHALNFDWRSGTEQVVTEGKVVPVQITDAIIANSVVLVGNWFGDFDAGG